MVGRDIGTVVTPDAGLKVYLDASAEERARRRWAELTARGEDVDYGAVLADLLRRDAYDAGREVAPLRAADDAVHVPTDGKTVEEIVNEVRTLADAVWAASEAH